MDGMGRHVFSRSSPGGDIVTPIRYYSPAERLRLIARYTSHLIKVLLGSIGVIAEPNVEVSKADASVRDL